MIRFLILFDMIVVNCFSLTYTKNIRPIFEKRCSQCHNARWSKANWLSYPITFKKRDMIKRRLEAGTMPPFGFNIPGEEKKAVIDWIRDGTKE